MKRRKEPARTVRELDKKELRRVIGGIRNPSRFRQAADGCVCHDPRDPRPDPDDPHLE